MGLRMFPTSKLGEVPTRTKARLNFGNGLGRELDFGGAVTPGRTGGLQRRDRHKSADRLQQGLFSGHASTCYCLLRFVSTVLVSIRRMINSE